MSLSNSSNLNLLLESSSASSRSGFLQGATGAAPLIVHRDRQYPPTVPLAMLLNQTLSDDGLRQKAVNGWIAQCVTEELKPPSARRMST